jgi:hypothetical protein
MDPGVELLFKKKTKKEGKIKPLYLEALFLASQEN